MLEDHENDDMLPNVALPWRAIRGHANQCYLVIVIPFIVRSNFRSCIPSHGIASHGITCHSMCTHHDHRFLFLLPVMETPKSCQMIPPTRASKNNVPQYAHSSCNFAMTFAHQSFRVANHILIWVAMDFPRIG